MDIALMIVALIACIVFIVLAYVTIGTMRSFKILAEKAEKNLDSITNDVSIVRNKIVQSLDEVSHLKSKVGIMVEEITDLKTNVAETLSHVDLLSKSLVESTENISNKSDVLFRMLEPIESLTRLLHTRIAGPISNSISFVSAASKAVSAFSGTLFKKK